MSITSISTLGSYVRSRREALSLTVTELALRAEMSKSEISALERGRISLPGADKRRRLAGVLGVTHLDLLVAAGEILEEEVVNTGRVGIVRRASTDPLQKLHDAIDETPMPPHYVQFLTEMFERWRSGEATAPRQEAAG